VNVLQDEVSDLKKELADLRTQQAMTSFEAQLLNIQTVKEVNMLAMEIPGATVEILRMLADKFRERYPKAGAAVIGNGPNVIAVLTEDLVKKGLKAGDLITGISGKGGGRPNLAQGSLPDADTKGALKKLFKVLEEKLK
jgi:alanyl-tRNA synthetase